MSVWALLESRYWRELPPVLCVKSLACDGFHLSQANEVIFFFLLGPFPLCSVLSLGCVVLLLISVGDREYIADKKMQASFLPPLLMIS